MEAYKNSQSGITHYELGDDFIKIWFKGNQWPYVYSDAVIGKPNIDLMKNLAVVGRGLATYINQHPEVKNGYDKLGNTAPETSPPSKDP